MFAGRCAAEVSLDHIVESNDKVLDTLFNEELGAVFQIRRGDETKFKRCFATCGPPPGLLKPLGYIKPTSKQNLTIKYKAQTILDLERAEMQQWWSNTSYEMQKLRDNPECAQSEFDSILDAKDPGLHYNLKFNPADVSLPALTSLKSLVYKPRGRHSKQSIQDLSNPSSRHSERAGCERSRRNGFRISSCWL